MEGAPGKKLFEILPERYETDGRSEAAEVMEGGGVNPIVQRARKNKRVLIYVHK